MVRQTNYIFWTIWNRLTKLHLLLAALQEYRWSVKCLMVYFFFSFFFQKNFLFNYLLYIYYYIHYCMEYIENLAKSLKIEKKTDLCVSDNRNSKKHIFRNVLWSSVSLSMCQSVCLSVYRLRVYKCSVSKTGLEILYPFGR